MKKALRETQTLRASCSKAKPKIFAPPQLYSWWSPAADPSRGRGTAKM